jgi:hypothetical protein
MAPRWRIKRCALLAHQCRIIVQPFLSELLFGGRIELGSLGLDMGIHVRAQEGREYRFDGSGAARIDVSCDQRIELCE